MNIARNKLKRENEGKNEKETPVGMTEDRDNSKKALGLLMFVILFFIYKQTVWDPFFYGSKKTAPDNSASNSEGTAIDGASHDAVQSSVEANVGSTQGTKIEPGKAVGEFPSDAEILANGILQVETETISAKIALLGARIIEYRLKQYLEKNVQGGDPLNLVSHVDSLPYPLGIDVGNITDARVNYQLVGEANDKFSLRAGQSQELLLEGILPDGRKLTKRLNFHGSGYVTEVRIFLANGATSPETASAASIGQSLSVSWTKFITEKNKRLLDPYDRSALVWDDGQKAHHEELQELREIDGNAKTLGAVRWVSMADKYFMASLMAESDFFQAQCKNAGDFYSCGIKTEMQQDGVALNLFAGPKSYEMLASVGNNLERSINFGMTGFIAAPLVMMLHLCYSAFDNYAVAIVLLTIIVRAALFPLNAASFKQMKAMQAVQPEIKRIRETITDKQQQQMELMNLYKKRGVNPLGGCLPMLLQMPIFIGLYSGLLLTIELRHAPFAFWITDLSAPEQLMVAGVGIPVMVILMVISMLVQQWMTPAAVDPAQKKVMMIMPVVFGFMFAKFPAGLTLYWLTSNLISIAQQKTLNVLGPKVSLMATGAVSLGLFLLTWLLSAVG